MSSEEKTFSAPVTQHGMGNAALDQQQNQEGETTTVSQLCKNSWLVDVGVCREGDKLSIRSQPQHGMQQGLPEQPAEITALQRAVCLQPCAAAAWKCSERCFQFASQAVPWEEGSAVLLCYVRMANPTVPHSCP